MTDNSQLEAIASELVRTFGIQTPPIPIEIMLQRPGPDMWDEVNITELSVGFLRTGGHFSPRMSLARLLARHCLQSHWGHQRNLHVLLKDDRDESRLQAFARMLIMPAEMVQALSISTRTPATISVQFEVPEEDARLRLTELGN